MAKQQVEELDELIERCAGIDVGQAEVVVCARVPDQSGKRCRIIESFGTTTPDLLALTTGWATDRGPPPLDA